MKAFWDEIDADGDGSIDEGELGALLARMGDGHGRNAATLMAEIDTDDDGSIDFEEFCGWLASLDMEPWVAEIVWGSIEIWLNATGGAQSEYFGKIKAAPAAEAQQLVTMAGGQAMI